LPKSGTLAIPHLDGHRWWMQLADQLKLEPAEIDQLLQGAALD
jgi:hypothetical protein